LTQKVCYLHINGILFATGVDIDREVTNIFDDLRQKALSDRCAEKVLIECTDFLSDGKPSISPFLKTYR